MQKHGLLATRRRYYRGSSLVGLLRIGHQHRSSLQLSRMISQEFKGIQVHTMMDVLLTGCSTRILIYTGHRKFGLVLAGHYFLEKNLVLAVKSEPDSDTAFAFLLFHCKIMGQVAVLHTPTL